MANVDLYANSDKQFDVARRRAQQQEGANLQGQKDAIARKAAALGGGPSGALIKQEQVAGDKSAERLQAANEGIEGQQAQEHQRIGEVLQGQQFQTGERVGAQNFAGQQAALQRRFATSERLGSQDFSHTERLGTQDFAATQQQKQIQAQFDMQWRQIREARAQGKIAAADAAAKLAELQRQFDVDTTENRKTNAISTILSAHNSGLDPGAVGELLKQLGYDITGIPGMTEASPPPPAPEPRVDPSTGQPRSGNPQRNPAPGH